MVSYKDVFFVTRLLKVRQHQMTDSFAALFEQSLNEIDISAILIALKLKGEAKNEILGASKIMRSKSLKISS